MSAAARLPTVAELEAATAATEAVYADPEATYADLLAALEAEEAAYGQICTGPCDTPVPEPEPEAEAAV